MIIFFALLSFWGWTLAAFFTVFYQMTGLILVMPLTLIFNRKTRSWMHAVSVMWGRSILICNPFWRLRVEGREHIQPGKHYVIVANHQSMLDILVALAGVPLHFKFMAKKELFSVPAMGWHMTLAGYIPIDRTNPQSGREALGGAEGWLAKGVSVLFFPEGTRSLDGEIKKFKVGAFKTARDQGVEILPVVIDGTGQALPKKSIIMKTVTKMVVQIGKPVAIGAGESLEQAAERIREMMTRRLAGLRKK